ISKPISDAVNKYVVQPAADKISDIPAVQKFATSPGGEATERGVTDLSNALNIMGTEAGFKGTIESAPEIVKTLKDVYNKIPDLIDASGNKLTDAVQQLKASVANVDPRLETSAERLPKPLATYNDFATQAENAVKDVKAEPPIATVGERIGDAFDKVMQMRKVAGQHMASELQNFADKPVPLEDGVGSLQKDLIDNGVQYDALDKKIIPGDASKFSQPDIKIMEKYASELQSLGSEPTAKQLDAFLSRMPQEIEGLKSSSGINFTTNAERILNSNMASLRDSLGEVATPDYNAARAAYSSLSKFKEEGSGFLGKTTQSGDFAKDASLAKSAAESILNNGKKDWLIKLEGLTGYPAMDESTMAIQAMKDAGDSRGLSLFKTLIDQAPTSPKGITDKLIGAGVDLGKRALVGNAKEQTQAFLKSLTPSEGETTLGNMVREGERGFIKIPGGDVKLSPATFAKNMNGADIPLVQNYLAEPTLDNFMKLGPVVEGAGLESLNIDNLTRFLKEAVAEHGRPETEEK
ncbi:MAG TPA: hypothetical protein VFA15_09820, partial [Nitrososphaera sp.]|nr:hypothetical protein [Nitrososphaera sp.]